MVSGDRRNIDVPFSSRSGTCLSPSRIRVCQTRDNFVERHRAKYQLSCDSTESRRRIESSQLRRGYNVLSPRLNLDTTPSGGRENFTIVCFSRKHCGSRLLQLTEIKLEGQRPTSTVLWRALPQWATNWPCSLSATSNPEGRSSVCQRHRHCLMHRKTDTQLP